MILIKNAKIYTMNNVIYDLGCIVIDDKKILEISSSIKTLKTNVDKVDKIIDVKGKFVLPGFIDPHCHIGLWGDSLGFEGEDGNETTDPMTPQLRAIDGIDFFDRGFKDAVQSGVTTVVTGPGSANVCGGQFIAIKTYGKRIEDVVVKDPVAVKIAFGENPKTVYNEKSQAPMTRMAIASILREALKKAREYGELLEKYEEDNDDRPDYDAKSEALLQVLKKEIPFKAHAHKASDILTAIRIAREFDVDLTIEHCTDGVLIKDILKDQNVPVIVGPILTDRSKPELVNQDAKIGGILSNEGILVALMTDHPCVPINYLVLQAAILSKEGMDEIKALEAITINAAKVCGIDNRVGSIETGKDADLVILDGHPFEFRTKVIMTIINGEVVYESN